MTTVSFNFDYIKMKVCARARAQSEHCLTQFQQLFPSPFWKEQENLRSRVFSFNSQLFAGRCARVRSRTIHTYTRVRALKYIVYVYFRPGMSRTFGERTTWLDSIAQIEERCKFFSAVTPVEDFRVVSLFLEESRVTRGERIVIPCDGRLLAPWPLPT